jgi:hypothetical protein
VDINTAFPSKYLRASDIGEQRPVVTIERVEMEPVGQSREMKPVVYFRGKDKGVVLNKTNAKKVIALAGGSTETDAWIGVQIRLYATEVPFQGEMVEAIRFMSPLSQPVAKPAPQEIPDDDSIPFMWAMPLLLPAMLAAHLVLA